MVPEIAKDPVEAMAKDSHARCRAFPSVASVGVSFAPEVMSIASSSGTGGTTSFRFAWACHEKEPRASPAVARLASVSSHGVIGESGGEENTGDAARSSPSPRFFHGPYHQERPVDTAEDIHDSGADPNQDTIPLVGAEEEEEASRGSPPPAVLATGGEERKKTHEDCIAARIARSCGGNDGHGPLSCRFFRSDENVS